MIDKSTILLIDVGGTNIRLGLMNGSDPVQQQFPQHVKRFPTRQFNDISAAIDHYLSDHPKYKIKQISISVATLVLGDQVTLTNYDWSFNTRDLVEKYNLQQIKVINDFTALALSLPLLSEQDLQAVSSGHSNPDSPIGLIGPGTGLGVSGLQKQSNIWHPIQGEGGHISIGANNPRELALFDILRSRHGHVSAERLLSGPSIEEVYQILCELDGKVVDALSADEISNTWIAASCEVCMEVMAIFCHWLGVVAGNLALTLGAKGGIYIGGGIVPKLGDAFLNSSFRESFNDHGCYSDYLSSIPVFIIHAEEPALLGAAIALGDEYNDLGIGYSI
ncbi:MAG: glucokinase [Cocleimonas sp.]|nr:glucokinase [Cocleimonas sp.]